MGVVGRDDNLIKLGVPGGLDVPCGLDDDDIPYIQRNKLLSRIKK